MAKATETIASNGGLAFSIPNLKKNKTDKFQQVKKFSGVVARLAGSGLSHNRDIIVSLPGHFYPIIEVEETISET